MEMEMKSITRIPLAAALLLAGGLLGSGIAYADMPGSGNLGLQAEAALVRLPVADAVARAEQMTGGKALSVALTKSGERDASFIVDLATGQGRTSVAIDAETGERLSEGSLPIVGAIMPGESNLAPAGHIGLVQALATVDQNKGSHIVDARLSENGNRAVYDVELMKRGLVRTVQVDAESGQIL
jgi:uncharacterized membrane protein YkoI